MTKYNTEIYYFTKQGLLLLALIMVSVAFNVAKSDMHKITRSFGHETEKKTLILRDIARDMKFVPSIIKEPKALHLPMPIPDNLPVPPESILPQIKKSVTSAAPVVPPAPLAPSPNTNKSFQALGDNNTSIPPDTHGAVGPNHLMTTLNTQVRIQDRNGGVLSTVTLNTFWSGLFNNSTFDPRVSYDHMSNRWISVALADSRSATSSLVIAVSANSDPTGTWYQFRIDADAADLVWIDFPSVGYNKDWIVVQTNMFTVAGNAFSRSHVYVFNKSDLYNNTGATFTLFQVNGRGGTQAPAVTFDSSASNLYLLQYWNPDSAGTGYLHVWNITGPVGSESIAELGYPASPAPWTGSVANNFAPQLGSATGIMVNDPRMNKVVFRNGSLWGAQTIFLPSGGTANRSSIQWWEINPVNSAVIQRSTIDDPAGTLFYAFPSIAVNRNSDAMIGYSRFSASQYASANYSYRSSSDPINTLRNDTVLKAGEDAYIKDYGAGRVRWGDYSSAVVDPRNDIAMWTIQEYAVTDVGVTSNDDRWGTWWGCVGDCNYAPSSDYDGDGKADILWRNTTTGSNILWQMDGGTLSTSTSINSVPTSFTVAGTGDFNGDGKADILWRRASTGGNILWEMDGATLLNSTSVTSVPASFTVAGIGDFNGDGRADILWRRASTGGNVLWEMDGATLSNSTSITTVHSNYTVAGIGDFGGDGRADILWRNTITGGNVLWEMDGPTLSSSTSITTVPTNWFVANISDYNGDGKDDLLWRDTVDGKNVLWEMDGATIIIPTEINPPVAVGQGWEIAGQQ